MHQLAVNLLDDAEIALRPLCRLPPGPQRAELLRQLLAQYDPAAQRNPQLQRVFLGVHTYLQLRAQALVSEDSRSATTGCGALTAQASKQQLSFAVLQSL